MVHLIVLFLLLLTPLQSTWADQDAGIPQYEHVRLNQIDITEDGFLKSVGNDPFLTLDGLDMDRASACFLVLDAEFQTPLHRPRLFELFWATSARGYSERHKAFVMVDQAASASRTNYVIPLCKLYGFSGNLHRPDAQQNLQGFRIDLPSNEKIAIKLFSIEFMDHVAFERFASSDAPRVSLEPYERLSAKAATSLDVITPKLVFAIEDGARRLWRDKLFLFSWLGIMGLLLFRIVRTK